MPVQRLLARAHAEELADDGRRLAPEARRNVGAPVGVAVLRRSPDDVKARILLGQGELQVRVVLVVAEEDVVPRSVAFDEVVLESKRLHFAVGHDEVEIGDLGHHGCLTKVPRACGLEIRPHAVPENAGLTHVEDAAGTILEEVDPWPRGQRLEFVGEGHPPDYALPPDGDETLSATRCLTSPVGQRERATAGVGVTPERELLRQIEAPDRSTIVSTKG